MLRDSVFEWISEEFGTSIGVAHIFGPWVEDGVSITEKWDKRDKDESAMNGMIMYMIDEGKYKEFQREVYRISQKSRKNIKEVTIYKKAFNDIIEKYNEQPTKV
jgi:hypothetical protein